MSNDVLREHRRRVDEQAGLVRTQDHAADAFRYAYLCMEAMKWQPSRLERVVAWFRS